MSDWPTSRKNDAPRGGEGETGLEAMVSAPRPPDCPRSAPALRGSFFAWEEKGTQARSVDARRRRAITAPSSAQSAARGGLKSAIPPPQSPFRGLFVEDRASANNPAGEGVCAALMRNPFWGKSAAEALAPEGAAPSRRRRQRKAARAGGLKRAIPPPQCRPRGLFVEFGSSGQREADRRGRQRFFAAVLCDWRSTRRMGPAFRLGSQLRANSSEAASRSEAAGSRDACGLLAHRRERHADPQGALSLTNSAMASVWPVWGNMFIAPAPTQR